MMPHRNKKVIHLCSQHVCVALLSMCHVFVVLACWRACVDDRCAPEAFQMLRSSIYTRSTAFVA